MTAGESSRQFAVRGSRCAPAAISTAVVFGHCHTAGIRSDGGEGWIAVRVVVIFLHFFAAEVFGFLLLFALAPEDDAEADKQGNNCDGDDDGNGGGSASA